jgi:fatty-acyl-CoA synthase
MVPTGSSQSRGTEGTPLLRETIGANLERIARVFGDRTAFVSCHQDVRFTYAAFDAAVDDLAVSLLGMGLEPGDRVGIWSPNYLEWAMVQYATAKIGVILVNINPAYRTHELTYALAQAGCRVLIAAPSFKTSDYSDMVASVRSQLPQLERAVFFWTDEWHSLREQASGTGIDRLRAASASLRHDDPINIQYTSGTTGFPKGATLSHHNILNNGYFVAEGLRYTEHDTVCVPVPLYHCFGMVIGNLGATTHGACVVYPEAAFDPAATLRALEAERCTSLFGVPTMFIAELAALGTPEFAGLDLSTLRTGLMAGSPCPVEVMKQVTSAMHMPEVGIAYGMTETSPVSTQTAIDDSLDRRCGTVGRAAPHVEISVVDPDTGVTMPIGEPGEFCTRGYSVMIGYWNDPEKTAQSIDADGWMHTGDLAVMDAEGYVNIVGRIKDMIIRGGENVYPREIEEFLHTHPSVADVQVIGVPDERYGEEIMAWIKLVDTADPVSVTADDIREFCRGRIAHFKIPRYVKFSAEFPMTVTGKVRKVEMREHAISELGLEAAAAVRNA